MPKKGYSPTAEHRHKLSLAALKNPNRYWLNREKPFLHDPTYLKRQSDSHKGAKCWNWQGGKSFEKYTINWTEDLRESIRKRDDYRCQMCGMAQSEMNGRHKKLSVHHIDYEKINLNPSNLISLCHRCHAKTCVKRGYWKLYFLNGFNYIEG
jgi:hypothetical protein